MVGCLLLMKRYGIIKVEHREGFLYFVMRNFFCDFITYQLKIQSLKMSTKDIERSINVFSPK